MWMYVRKASGATIYLPAFILFYFIFFCIPFPPFILSHVLNYKSKDGIIGHENRNQLCVGGASLGQYYLDH